MIIDAHAHVIVEALTREANPGQPWLPSVRRADGRQIVEFGGREITSAVHEFVDVETILATQRAVGVDRVVLSPWVVLLGGDLPPAEAMRWAQVQNAALAALAAAYPSRVSVLGTVPLHDPRVAARELRDLLTLPGMAGVEITASVAGTYLGDDRFEPFWEAAADAAALVFVHPTTKGFAVPALTDYHLSNAVGNPLETTVAAAHLIMSGVLERHPRLKLLLAHGGGTILSLRGRLRHAHAVHPDARARLRESPEASLRRFYFDTVTHDDALLRALIEFAGAEHVVLGSDYPFEMGVADPAGAVRRLALPTSDESAILGGNAARLLGMEVRADGAGLR